MIERPVFKPTFHVEVVEPEGVFLLSEQGHFVLKGDLYCAIAPLLDGRHSADAIVDALADEASAAEVYYALSTMESKGYIAAPAPEISSERAAFWHAAGIDPVTAERRLRETPVAVVTAGAVASEPFVAALGDMGLWIAGEGALTLVVTDDYLQEGLAEINAVALASGKPWLLVKPVGTQIWIGPIFRPGATACWECLAHRLRGNREVEGYLQGRQGRRAPFPVSRAATPVSLQAAAQLAALEAVKAIARDSRQSVPPAPHTGERAEESSHAGATLVTLDLLALETRRHTVLRLSQCPRCGDPSPFAPRPLALVRRVKPLLAAGSHRTRSPEQILAQYERHVSPITGAVSALNRLRSENDVLLHAWSAGYRSALPSDAPSAPPRSPRGGGGGKGATDLEAQVSALCEALETYSAGFHGDEPRRRATYHELGDEAIHPATCTLFSADQYQRRLEWNARNPKGRWIPEPLGERTPIDWTPVWSLTRQAFRYLPTEYCYHQAPLAQGVRYSPPDPSGHAVGATLEEAVRHGLLELIERDSVAIWWYNRLRRPALDLDSFDEPYVAAVRRHYREHGRELWVLDLTTDLGLPVFAALAQRRDAAGQFLIGFGADLDPRTGLLRAVTELNQFHAMMSPALGGREPADRPLDPLAESRAWWRRATPAEHPYLTPDPAAPARRRSDYAELWSDDVRDDVVRCQRALEAQGLELLVLDQTRREIRLPAVQVIVPGLRHFRPRLAPGRLYDVPVRLGWLREPWSEDGLNPVPLML